MLASKQPMIYYQIYWVICVSNDCLIQMVVVEYEDWSTLYNAEIWYVVSNIIQVLIVAEKIYRLSLNSNILGFLRKIYFIIFNIF